MTRRPTPVTPIDAEPSAVTERFGPGRGELDESVLAALRAAGVEVSTLVADRNETGRDWWPLAIGWAAHGEVPARAAAVARPTNAAGVAAVLRAAQAAHLPVTAMAGRSGVCGGAVPVFGGIALDLTGLGGLLDLDEVSLVADVAAGTFGPDLEDALGARGAGYTLGHWPQSMDISTVGGWLACRGAGQYSTRYGKIEDMVLGLEVVLADGRIIHTEGAGPRAATGPNLTQLFVGSEGTLGVITAARLRVHPLPVANARRAYAFGDLGAGLEACRLMLRRGATPAVLRLYDEAESRRNFDEGERCVLIVFDEADAGLLAATIAVVDEECADAARLDDALVDRWLAERNDTSALAPLWRAGIVVDTVEVAARWSVLPALCDEVRAALRAIEGTIAASVHESHAYPDGACVYFTFAGRRPDGAGLDEAAWPEDYYRRAWDAVMAVTHRHGAAISHHHGIGLNRGRHLAEALGPSFDVLVAIKAALDPAGILNPGKLGLPGPFGGRALAVSESLLVVDVGTSGVRAAVVRPDAAVDHVHHVPVLPQTPAPGLVEVDAEAIAQAVLDVAAAALADGGPVGGVGITNQRATTVVWERATGRPVAPGIGWQDLRTLITCLTLQADGFHFAPNASATKAAAILDDVDPERARAAAELCIGTIDSWVAWTLSGGADGGRLHVTDATNAAVTGLVGIDPVRWDARALEVLRIPAACLPEIVDSTGALGPADALRGSPPICAVAGDQQASLIGQGCTRPGLAKVTFGTGGSLNMCTGPGVPATLGRHQHGTFPIVAWQRAGVATYGVEGIILSAGTCIEWLRDDLGLISSAVDSATVAAACSDTGGVWFVPALLGLGTPVWDFGRGGTLLGLTRGTGRAEIVRAVLEGLAQRGADLLEAAEADGGLRPEALRLDGGMSANEVFVRALAEAVGRPVEVSATREATTLGAGFLAGLAIGTWRDEDDVAAAYRPAATVEPAAPEAERTARRAKWLEARQRAEKVIPELSTITF